MRPALSCVAAAMLVMGCASAPEAGGDADTDAPPDTTAGARAERGGQAAADTAGATLPSTRREIERLVGEARADGSSACRLVGLGARPCGGPRAWVAYSVQETDSAQLAALVDLYARLDRERNEREGLVSTCEVVPRPQVVWEGGRCVAGGEFREAASREGPGVAPRPTPR